jgi:hypothetical protein
MNAVVNIIRPYYAERVETVRYSVCVQVSTISRF